MSYADTTYNSKNPLQRFAHRTRFKKSMEKIDLKKGEKLLDYGCGDGMFIDQISNLCGEDNIIVGFEPYMPLLDNDSAKNISRTVDSLIQAYPHFDVITCFEVLEHFNPKGQEELLNQIYQLLNTNGRVVISVPIEIYFPALVKNLNRKKMHDGPVYSMKNIFFSILGSTSKLKSLREPDGYLSHMGFDHRQLEKIIKKFFTIEKKECSPFQWLGSICNSQVFYTLKK